MGKITIQGASSSIRAAMRAPESRRVRFPDGQRRFVTLPSRIWAGYDELDARLGVAGDYESWAYTEALAEHPEGSPDFEVVLQEMFALVVRRCWGLHTEEVFGSINENTPR